MRPNRAATSETIRRISNGLDMSAAETIEPRIKCEIPSSLLLERATSATLAPLLARSFAVASPMPDDAPVTIAFFRATSIPSPQSPSGSDPAPVGPRAGHTALDILMIAPSQGTVKQCARHPAAGDTTRLFGRWMAIFTPGRFAHCVALQLRRPASKAVAQAGDLLTSTVQGDSAMTTDDLVLWSMSVALIATGLPVVYLARYYLASERRKRPRARHLVGIGLIWLVGGAGIYIRVLIGRFAQPSRSSSRGATDTEDAQLLRTAYATAI